MLRSLLPLFLCCSFFGGCEGPVPSGPRVAAQPVGGPFEGREIFFVGMPEEIAAADTTAGWYGGGPRLVVTGTIFRPDGKTPAPDVVLYYYHTDTTGRYETAPNLDPRAVRHGYLRGWVKTDRNGRYAIHTVRPASYPGGRAPAHIHPAVLEPGIPDPYYLDEFTFDDDPLMTTELRLAAQNRGGSGVLRLLYRDGVQLAEHDLVLGLNVPGHPAGRTATPTSGPAIGEDVFSFTPYHAWGPDRGTRTCPVCKYGRYQGLLYFLGEGADRADVADWLVELETASRRSGGRLKVYLVDGDPSTPEPARRKRLSALGERLDLRHVALTTVPHLADQTTEIHRNRLDPAVGTTLILYRHGGVVDRYTDLAPTAENRERLLRRLAETRGAFSDLPVFKPAGHRDR